jgi:hypothetical protein
MSRRWSREEDAVLRRLYPQGVGLHVIGERVGRSHEAVSARRRALGIAGRPRSQAWTAGEDELLRAGTVTGISAAAVAVHLRRPPDQVRRRRRMLMEGGRAPLPYTISEDTAIADCWMHGDDVVVLAQQIGRSVGSIRLRAQKLGLHTAVARPRWRPDEDATLRDGYQLGLTCAQIAAEIGGRTPTAIAARAARLGLGTYGRRWTSREDNMLRKLTLDGTDLDRAAQLLARTPEAVRRRARVLGLALPPRHRPNRERRPWASTEDELLALHRGLNPAALAQLLDRSSGAITQRMRKLDLRRGSERSPHHPARTDGHLTPGQRAVIARELEAGAHRRQLAVARRLDVPPSVIRRVAGGLLTSDVRSGR